MLYPYNEKYPQLHEEAWVADSCDLIGDIILEQNASVFFQTVIRADKGQIHIQEGSNIQDHCTLHTDIGYAIQIGRHVSVGHGCILHGCRIDDESLIGMGAIILNGAHIGKHCIIGAGALVSEGMEIPDGSVAVGIPAKIIKNIRSDQIQMIKENAEVYCSLSKEYKEYTL